MALVKKRGNWKEFPLGLIGVTKGKEWSDMENLVCFWIRDAQIKELWKHEPLMYKGHKLCVYEPHNVGINGKTQEYSHGDIEWFEEDGT
jgi:hypothetical protein